MTYSTTITTKGQITLPAVFRKKLGLKPGERVLVEQCGDKMVVRKDNWLADLRRVQEENRAFMKERAIKPLTDEALDDAINAAAEEAAVDRYKRSLGL